MNAVILSEDIRMVACKFFPGRHLTSIGGGFDMGSELGFALAERWFPKVWLLLLLWQFSETVLKPTQAGNKKKFSRDMLGNSSRQTTNGSHLVETFFSEEPLHIVIDDLKLLTTEVLNSDEEEDAEEGEEEEATVEVQSKPK